MAKFWAKNVKILTHWVKWVKKWVMSKEKILINHYLLSHTVALVISLTFQCRISSNDNLRKRRFLWQFFISSLTRFVSLIIIFVASSISVDKCFLALLRHFSLLFLMSAWQPWPWFVVKFQDFLVTTFVFLFLPMILGGIFPPPFAFEQLYLNIFPPLCKVAFLPPFWACPSCLTQNA